ncbi:MAG: hypothetical protein KDI37_14205 [Xanthomonadales bacterium]|nr:hypothetical protein [Xanthomonadales bacterium]
MSRRRGKPRLTLLWLAGLASAWAWAGWNGTLVHEAPTTAPNWQGSPRMALETASDFVGPLLPGERTPRSESDASDLSADPSALALIESRVQQAVMADLPEGARFTLADVNDFELLPAEARILGWGLVDLSSGGVQVLELDASMDRQDLQLTRWQATLRDGDGRLLRHWRSDVALLATAQ